MSHDPSNPLVDREPELPYDAAAKPIWEQFEEVLASIPAAEFARLPVDGAEL